MIDRGKNSPTFASFPEKGVRTYGLRCECIRSYLMSVSLRFSESSKRKGSIRTLIMTLLLIMSELTSSELVQGLCTESKRDHFTFVLTDDVSLSEDDIKEGQRRLVRLGYWIAPPNDEQTSQALIAFQKVEGREITGKWTATELAAIRRASRPKPLEAGFQHVEIDLTRQVLFLVDTDSVKLILPVATGTGRMFSDGGWTRRAITPTGRFKVYRKVEGWRGSSLGQLYYPNYITGGVAIHGSRSVSTEPSSFGCIRIPMYAAAEFSEITPLGTIVIVYGRFKPRRTNSFGSHR